MKGSLFLVPNGIRPVMQRTAIEVRNVWEFSFWSKRPLSRETANIKPCFKQAVNLLFQINYRIKVSTKLAIVTIYSLKVSFSMKILIRDVLSLLLGLFSDVRGPVLSVLQFYFVFALFSLHMTPRRNNINCDRAVCS